MTDLKAELLPCPFCRCPATAMQDMGTKLWAVDCNNDGTWGDDGPTPCLARGPERPTKAEAIAAWNTRPQPSPKVDGLWQPIETAPKDGTLVLLLVDYSDGDHWIDDELTGLGRTIGHNNDDNVGEGEGEGWQFAGWCWSHDHYVEGRGRPIKWMPLPDAQVQP